MLRRRLFHALIALISAIAGGLLLPSPTPAVASYYIPIDDWTQILSYQSSKCINDPNNDVRDNIRMIIYDCVNSPGTYNEQWKIHPVGSGTYNIVNRRSNKCLTVQNASTANNYPVIQYTCNSNPNELWRLADSPQGVLYIVNENSDRCLTVKNASIANGAELLQYTCNGGFNQQWF